MHKVVIKISNNKNYEMFLNMLKHIDFVDIETTDTFVDKTENNKKNNAENLFGMWAGRDIDLKKIRNKAWR